jgi:YD repeat-containing protein
MGFSRFQKSILFTAFAWLLMVLPQHALAIKIEEAMRALQERHLLCYGVDEPMPWPNRQIDNANPGEFPPDGFYAEDMRDPVRAAYLVDVLKRHLDGAYFWDNVLAPEVETLNGYEGWFPPMLEIGSHNLPGLITASNYIQSFQTIAKIIMGMRFYLEYPSMRDYNQVAVTSAAPTTQQAWSNLQTMNFRNDFAPQVTEYKRWIDDEGQISENVFRSTSQDDAVKIIIGSKFASARALRNARLKADLSRFKSGSAEAFLKYQASSEGNILPPPHPHGVRRFGSIGSMPIDQSSSSSGIVPNSEISPQRYVSLPGTGHWGWSLGDPVSFESWILIRPDFNHTISEFDGQEEEDCESCSTGNCSLGSGSFRLDKRDGVADIRFDLGRDSAGDRGISMGLKFAAPAAQNYTTANLNLFGTSGAVLIKDAVENPRQLKAPEVTADVVTLSSSKYQIKFYKPSQVSASINASGVYTFSGSPFQTWTIENPSAEDISSLKLTETSGSLSISQEITWIFGSDGSKETIFTSGNGLKKESSKTTTDVNGDRVQTYTVMNADNSIAYKEENTFHVFPWSEEQIKKVVDPAGAKLTTTWSYYEDSSDVSNYKNLKQVVQPSGYWEKYTYDTYGRVIKTVSQFKNNSTTSAETSNRVFETVYADGDPAITVIEKLQGQEISRRYTVYRPGETRVIQAHTPTATWDDPKNLVTITKTLLGTEFQGEVESIQHPDGTLTTFSYSKSGNQKTVTTQTGAASGGSVTDGTRTVAVSRLDGTRLSEHQYDISSGVLISSEIVTKQDDFGRPTTIQYLDGTTSSKSYGCCGLESETDREGITTTYIYDDLKQVKSFTRAGITTLYSYDANGNVLTTTRKGSDNSSIVVSTRTYDQTGRLKSDKNALNNTTTFVESKDSSGQTLRTTTDPLGNKVTDTFFKDGSLRYQKGTAAHPIQMDYGATTSNETFEKQIFLGAAGETTEWATSYRDFLGRVNRRVMPGSAIERNYFNNQGQLIKQTDPDGVTTLYQYNSRGEIFRTAVDMNKNGSIDLSGTDRITETTRSVISSGASGRGTAVLRTTQKVYTSDGASSTREVSVLDQSVDGLQTWSTVAGVTTHSRTFFDSPEVRRIVTTQPDGTVSTQTFNQGRLSTAVTQNPATGVLSSFSYAYDAHGRQKSISDVRTGATTLTYDSGDRLKTVKTPVPSSGQSGQTTTFY